MFFLLYHKGRVVEYESTRRDEGGFNRFDNMKDFQFSSTTLMLFSSIPLSSRFNSHPSMYADPDFSESRIG